MADSQRSYFALSESKLDIKKLKQELENAHAGALVTFEGWVRNHNEGQPVERLDYEAFETLAETEGNQIIQEALARFEIDDAICLHRTGRLIIGDCAVWVGVTAAHRDAAFQAARYIIDDIKTRLPIWKKEHYKNGEAVWVNCQQCAHGHIRHEEAIHLHARDSQLASSPTQRVAINETEYYQRQVILPQIGADGQRKLQEARVLVVGAGGLGSSALLHLAGAGVGQIGICEFDCLEVSNLHRQILYSAADVGQSKASLAAKRLHEFNPNIRVVVHAEKLESTGLAPLLEQYDLILDCTDTISTRLMMNDAAVMLQKPLIQAGVYQYEGQIHLIAPGMGGCLRCQWPDNMEPDAPGTCMQSGVLGAVPGLFGTLQAMEAIKWLVGLPTPLSDHVLILDLLSYQQHLIRRTSQPDCSVCGRFHEQQLDHQLTQERLAEVPTEESDSVWQLIFTGAPLRLTQFTLIDVNESREHSPIPDLTVQNIPFSRFELDHPPPLDKEKQYLLYCSKGVRSAHLVRELRKRGFTNVFALAGGQAKQDLAELRKLELEKANLYYVRH